MTLDQAWQLANRISLALLTLGVVAALADWTVSVALLLGALAVAIGGHTAVGITGYRRAMSRPWPAVAPLDDED